MQITLPSEVPPEALATFLAAHGLRLTRDPDGRYSTEALPLGAGAPSDRVRRLMGPTLEAMSTLRDQLAWQPTTLAYVRPDRFTTRGYIVEFTDMRSGSPYVVTMLPGHRVIEGRPHASE